ncbi:hypothetical protein [Roseomonas sp. CECT 9278]|uniref:hypothetical protein n=1 Tax=Roseomonas sp. CECT 9278 TaxID=2845823 RepID=UPI001E2BDDA7|nr:hypothetical protein [Roseomonas sp. CECT 9278]
MGVLIVAGTVTLVVLLVQRSGGGAPAARGPTASEARPFNLVLGEPAGSRIGAIAAAGGALAIWVVRPDGERVVLVDPATGRATGEVRLRD